MKAKVESKALHLHLDQKVVERVDEFRWKNRIASRKDAIEWLLRFALEQKPQVKVEARAS